MLPERPAGTEALTEEQLAGLVTRDEHGRAWPGGRAVTAALPELDVDGPAAPPRSNGELVFGEPWEGRAFGLVMALVDSGRLSYEDFRRR